MKVLLFVVLGVWITGHASGQTTATSEEAIRRVLNQQVEAWNAGNIVQFMEGYWKSDSIQFIGSEITYGWAATLERYKRSYPGKEAMGVLRFDLLRFDFIGPDACLLTGKYFLTRKNDNPHGIFTLLFRKKAGAWVIVYDHTS